ncbi:hypothetical protein GPY61_00930 [Massilia sp. NEAU-DD11]|uniref:FecR protein domain-containing protein n=1 Tax=Massilia cellulosiltytica TaxID=2683234 RepID=A0A7X3K5A5_9BURK|nr:hypothetical protein [Telluria cellulosilytica]MVW58488.1 hypothetical protein [Telluria cellulosilytica]
MRYRFLFICLLLAAAAPRAAEPAPRTVLTLADQPLRLIRGAAVYKAGSGVAVQKDDILETETAGAQVEAGADAIVALGPQSRVLVANLAPDGKSPVELELLQGWAKVYAKGRRAVVVTPALQVTVPSGSTIVHAGEGLDAVFAEEGEQQVARAGTVLKLVTEQYAGIDADKQQLVTSRPPRAFVSAMPPAFRDHLARVPGVRNAGKAAPVKERDAAYADVDDWLASTLPARRRFVARFKPRLSDPDFRRQIDRALGQSPDWKPVLHPARRPDNGLF